MSKPNPVDQQVGGRVRSRRISMGMSPESLAGALGSTIFRLKQWETGSVRIGAIQLQRLAEILDVSPMFFFADAKPSASREEGGAQESSSLQTILGSTPSFEILRLLRSFAAIENRATREAVIKYVEKTAEMESDANRSLDPA